MTLIPLITTSIFFFRFNGKITNVKEYGNGHINKTFLIETTENRYIYQIINSYAFGDVEMLMRNINIVTKHLANHGSTTLEVVKTFDGANYYSDKLHYFRMYTFVEDTVCYEEINDLSLVKKTGEAFGDLHVKLSTLDPKLIFEIIKDFHNTPIRYKNLMKAVKENSFGRLDSCKEEVEYLTKQKDGISQIIKGIENKTIPMRITHNDPKINNVLFDKNDGSVKCVIDLDTIMPGSCLYDFGDALRSLFTGDNEDSEDLSKLKVNKEVYQAYLDGYASRMKNDLTRREKELLPMSIYIIAIELACRFLEDYLKGDVYFHVSKKAHNLLRARTQIALAKDVIENLDELDKITKKVLEK